MRTNQGLQVGAEALSGIVAGALASAAVQLPLIVCGLLALTASALLAALLRPATTQS
ncbi:hypothetical protein GCM10007874_31410 [Labrys miyagiensis]|uniref:MFS transporter n=1 Tax=Labrys miyagiensis TaxID=346912 RepID=A0ABQ6CIT6_9HYPH|nr:hypothetical protein GCM10007874_31410 [Labrys miyagiensis]